ncbi:MAG: sigma-70 family RNA polymerase sigma factor [Clostridia bacterium]|nr:sigma-70 family RNA polymerase sigma factor [Clostridia bacterium]
MEDEKIVALYWERDENAIRETETKYGRYCYSIAYNILHSPEDSEECVNDTWNGAWNAMPPEKPSRLQSFLARITRNIAIDRYRYDNAQKRGAEVESAIEEYWECIPNGEASIEDEALLSMAINDFLASLNKRSRMIFMRRYWYSMSVKEIAKGMCLSESHVSVILHRTRIRFRDHLIMEGIGMLT